MIFRDERHRTRDGSAVHQFSRRCSGDVQRTPQLTLAGRLDLVERYVHHLAMPKHRGVPFSSHREILDGC